MLHPDDLRAVRSRFGAADEQVRRDHLIAHLLAAVQDCDAGELVLVGGAGLGLTCLPGGRLTENVDLSARPRAAVADWLARELPRRLRREFPGLVWWPAPGPVPDPPGTAEPACVRTPDGLVVRVRLTAAGPEPGRYPVRRGALRIRYRDVAPVELTVPTPRAFAVLTAAAWLDRHAPRDLFDLSGLVGVGAVDPGAAALARRLLGRTVRRHDFGPPVPPDWRAQLAHQTAHLPPPQHCLAVVGEAWERAVDGCPADG